MAAAVKEKGFRPGMVSVVQTFGDQANFHPHVHALVSRGGWSASGEWIPVAYVDEGAAEKRFRHKVLALLRRRGLLTEERIDLLMSWRRSGFSVHNRVYVPAGDRQGPEALARMPLGGSLSSWERNSWMRVAASRSQGTRSSTQSGLADTTSMGRAVGGR